MNVEEELRAIVEKRRRDAPPIHADSKLADLNIDSLDLIEMLFEVEETFDIHLAQSNEQAASASFAELSLWVEQAIAQKGQIAPAGAAIGPRGADR